MSLPPTSGSDSKRLEFAITGDITVWDPIRRYLQIGMRDFLVAPEVSIADPRLGPGIKVTVLGHQDNLTARWIVTQLTRG
jgi:hypothetical protein